MWAKRLRALALCLAQAAPPFAAAQTLREDTPETLSSFPLPQPPQARCCCRSPAAGLAERGPPLPGPSDPARTDKGARAMFTHFTHAAAPRRAAYPIPAAAPWPVRAKLKGRAP